MEKAALSGSLIRETERFAFFHGLFRSAFIDDKSVATPLFLYQNHA